MRVLHVITGLYTGGAETMLLRLVERSQGRGLEHAVIALLAGGPVGARLTAAGIPVTAVGVGPGAPLRIARWIRAWRPALCQGWMYHGNLAALVGRVLSGRRVVLGWGIRHCPDPSLSTESRSSRLVIRTGGRLSRLPRAIVYCSKASVGVHENRLGYDPARRVLIPNGFDGELLHPRADAGTRLRQELGLPPSTTLIGSVARYHPMKDHANLIRAFARLGGPGAEAHRAGSPVHLVLIGRGLDGDNLELVEQIRTAGIAPRVSLLGERNDIPTLLAGLDVLAVASAWGEAFPNVIGEAMASGVPCVTTDVGDAAWIAGETGIVVPPRDATALAGGLGRMIERPPEERRRLGAAARRRILDHFALTEVVARYVELFHEITEGGRPWRAA